MSMDVALALLLLLLLLLFLKVPSDCEYGCFSLFFFFEDNDDDFLGPLSGFNDVARVGCLAPRAPGPLADALGEVDVSNFWSLFRRIATDLSRVG